MGDSNFPADNLARLRAHEVAAVEQFVHAYEPVLLGFVGRRLWRSGVGFDGADIAQEVFAKFFAKLGRDLEFAPSEDELVKVLLK